MAYVWTPAWSVGVDSIDEQHKELFARVNALIAAASQGKGREEIGSVVQFLGDYVARHFVDEEKLQIKYAYPHYSEHKAEHSRFILDFAVLKKEFTEQGATSTTVIAIQRRVGDWLVNHIHKVDVQLGEYLKTVVPPSQAGARRG
jgi:hemerythrin